MRTPKNLFQEILQAYEEELNAKIHDPGKTWLVLGFLNSFLHRYAPPYPRNVSIAICEISRLGVPGSGRERLIQALKPLESKYKSSLYNSIFGQRFDLTHIGQAFEDNVKDIVEVVYPLMQEAVGKEMQKISPDGKLPKSSFLRRLKELSATFNLSKAEAEILSIFVTDRIDSRFRNLLDALAGKDSYFHARSEKLERIQRLQFVVPNPHLNYFEILGEENKLRRLGFLDRDLYPSEEILNYLLGSSKEPLSDRYFKRWSGEALPLERLSISESEVKTIQTLILNRHPGKGLNILIGGVQGTGKTETVRSICKTFGLNLYEIRSFAANVKSSEQTDTNFRIRAAYAAQNLIGEKDTAAAILIDEADSLLNNNSSKGLFRFLFTQPHTDKSVLNEVLDRSRCIQFWVANNIEGIDLSTRRRFDYAIKYEHATPALRQSIWQTACEKYDLTGILDINQQKRLAATYNVEAGIIDTCLGNAAHLPSLGICDQCVIEHVEKLIEAQKCFNPEAVADSNKTHKPKILVSPDALNIFPQRDLAAVLKILTNPVHQNSLSLNLLFSGPPGTGKSLLAQTIADSIGRPLHHKTAADILSKFVGEAEMNIREAFRNAERENAVLFFDEFDGLLSSRENASHRWETTQVNELLSALESFNGIFIAATNHEAALDKAALRRFHFNLRFESLTAEGALIFYQALLMPFAADDFGSNESAALAGIQGLVPGDFGTLRDRLTLLPDEKTTHRQLIEDLQERRNCRHGNPAAEIGFCKDLNR